MRQDTNRYHTRNGHRAAMTGGGSLSPYSPMTFLTFALVHTASRRMQKVQGHQLGRHGAALAACPRRAAEELPREGGNLKKRNNKGLARRASDTSFLFGRTTRSSGREPQAGARDRMVGAPGPSRP